MAIGDTNTCAREGCENTFVLKTHNNKYCSLDCSKEETNKRIMRRYYKRKERRSAKGRVCEVCNETKLSMYNDSDICGQCDNIQDSTLRNSVVRLLDSVVL
jgi:hypothetical protein